MPVWPKSFYSFGINLRTAGTEWKLRQNRSAPKQQQRAFAQLIDRLAATRYWQAAGIERRMSYDRFRARVPLHTHERLAPAIEQMQHGETDVLWPGRCSLFALTAGTTTGIPRALPVTEELLAHIRRAGRDALLYYTVRVRHAGAVRGRHLLLGGPTELKPLATSAGGAAFVGDASGVFAVSLPRWAEKHLYEPGVSVARIADWDERVQAILARTCQCDISLVAGTPTALLGVANVLREACAENGQTLTHAQQVWPNLECVMHTGMPAAPYEHELRAAFGTRVALHDVYAATEAFIAAQDGEASRGLRLIADAGVLFEFVAMSDFDPDRFDQLGAKALPLAEAKPGVDYVPLITTPGGLARYVLDDVIRFTSIEPPRLSYIGRTHLRLHTWGENVTDKEVTDALVAVCHQHHWSVVNFHVAPLFTRGSLTGQNRGRHEWWVELRPGTVVTPTGPHLAAALDASLQHANAGYAERRASGAIDAPFVRLVMPGVFEHWLRFKGKWGGQHKLPRCRSDRLIADELAQVTNFAHD